MTKSKTVILSCLIGASTFIALLISYWIGEKYFFDKLFYKKSIAYGYSNDAWNIATSHDIPHGLKDRVKDVVYVNNLYNASVNSKVLGTSDFGQDDDFVIVIIGDSFIYGMGIREEKRLGKLLEKKLNSLHPTKVYILAQSGDGIIENYTKFILANKYLKPDLYIFGIVNNDLVFESYDKYPLQEDLYNGIKQFCPGEEFLWLEIFKESSWEDAVANQYAASFFPKYSNVCILKKIVENIQNISDKVLFYSFYQENNDIDNINSELERLHATFMKKYTDTIKEAGGHAVFQPNDYFWSGVSNKEGHPSVQANEDFAEQLFIEITNNGYWEFPYSK